MKVSEVAPKPTKETGCIDEPSARRDRCGKRLEMMLLKGVKPRWDISQDAKGRVSLHPSVWLRDGCKSHFWVRAGKNVWCE
jgi:hypothetical protein